MGGKNQKKRNSRLLIHVVF